ncbi:hypothetical protein H0H87_012220 [Tephrocybe sp. NHM501043]|nr:hypothetical protein H0H87_012220 [Tephrocybe sp. NHM501043]
MADLTAGGWLRAHPLPADKGSFGNFEALSQQNRQVIQRILEADTIETSVKPTPDEAILRKLRDFYASCVNEDTLDALGSTPLLDFIHALRKKFRGEFKNPKSDESTDLTAALEYYKDTVVLEVYKKVIERLLVAVSEDEGDAKGVKVPAIMTNQESNVWPPWPWPPWDEDEDDKDGDKKPTNSTQRARKLTKKIVKLEKSLAKASLDLDILFQDPIATYNPLPVSNLTDALPEIDFPAYFAAYTPRNFPSTVVMTYPEYATSLAKILNETSPDVVEAYLLVRATLTLSPHLGMSTEAWQAQQTLFELLNGIKKGAVGDRSEYCIGKVEESMGFAVGRYFANETFAGGSKEKGTKIITNIVKAFKASLPHIDWMDKKSSNAAAEKADAIRVKVGYPVSPNTTDPSSIARYYSLVEINRVNFFNNVLSAAKSDQYKKWQQLGKRRDIDSWEMYPSMVNAYFNPPANEIVFPAGILQPPFFDANWPSYISYGAFGHVAAHELTHAFDSAGRLYNQDGKLEEWWTNSTSKGFQVKQTCIVDQYSGLSVPQAESKHLT